MAAGKFSRWAIMFRVYTKIVVKGVAKADNPTSSWQMIRIVFSKRTIQIWKLHYQPPGSQESRLRYKKIRAG